MGSNGGSGGHRTGPKPAVRKDSLALARRPRHVPGHCRLIGRAVILRGLGSLATAIAEPSCLRLPPTRPKERQRNDPARLSRRLKERQRRRHDRRLLIELAGTTRCMPERIVHESRARRVDERRDRPRRTNRDRGQPSRFEMS